MQYQVIILFRIDNIFLKKRIDNVFKIKQKQIGLNT